MSPTSYLLLYYAMCVGTFNEITFFEPVSAVADMSPTNCLMLYPAMCLL